MTLCQTSIFFSRVNAPSNSILLGAKGASSSAAITTLAQAAVDNDYRGVMVWYASVKNGFHYAVYFQKLNREMTYF